MATKAELEAQVEELTAHVGSLAARVERGAPLGPQTPDTHIVLDKGETKTIEKALHSVVVSVGKVLVLTPDGFTATADTEGDGELVLANSGTATLVAQEASRVGLVYRESVDLRRKGRR
jgi:hypothetical protein